MNIKFLAMLAITGTLTTVLPTSAAFADEMTTNPNTQVDSNQPDPSVEMPMQDATNPNSLDSAQPSDDMSNNSNNLNNSPTMNNDNNLDNAPSVNNTPNDMSSSSGSMDQNNQTTNPATGDQVTRDTPSGEADY